MLLNYIKSAWRNLGKSRMHSIINICGLSLGMAVAITIGLWIYDEVSFNKQFKNHDRIGQVIQNVTNNGEVQTWFNMPWPLAEELRKNYGSDFKQVVMSVSWYDHLLTYENKKIKQNGGYFEKGLPEMLSLDVKSGSKNMDDPYQILLSESAARSFFGNDNAIGKMLKIDDMPVVKVGGVYADFPRNSDFADLHFIASWDFLYNNDNGFKSMREPWRPNFTTVYVQLNENADFEKVSAKIKDAKLKNVSPMLQQKKPALFLLPMDRWHLYSEFKNGVNVGGAIQYVWMFGIIGLFVLILACINFMNLSTARSEKRAKEVGIRKTIGSMRRQLIVQFLTESILTVVLAFLFSILMIQLLIPFFNTVAEKKLSIPWTNANFWLLSLAFTLVTALLAGCYPAFYLSSFRPVSVLKGTFKAGRLASMPRKVLVVVQFTVSAILIIGTSVVYRQIQFAKDRPIGYDRSGVMAVQAGTDEIHKHFDAIKKELVNSGAVVEMSEAASLPTGTAGSSSGFSWQGKDPNLSVDFLFMTISWDYGKTIDWGLRSGRDFSRDFPSDTTAMIINESAVRYMGFTNAVGQMIKWNDNVFQVVGVVGDIISQNPYETVKPSVYVLNKDRDNVALLKLNPTMSASAALDKIAPVFRKFNPEQPFEYNFADEEFAKKFKTEVRIGKLAGFFSFLAIVISCLGLFGLASFVAEQRTKEIGVRKVLGASVFSVWNLLSKDFVILVLISFLIASPLAWLMMKQWLQNYSYRVSISWQIFAFAGLLSIVIALVTVSFQAIRAALANPTRSLRTE